MFCLHLGTYLPAIPSAYSLDRVGFGMSPVAQGERQLATGVPAPLEGTETSLQHYFHTLSPTLEQSEAAW